MERPCIRLPKDAPCQTCNKNRLARAGLEPRAFLPPALFGIRAYVPSGRILMESHWLPLLATLDESGAPLYFLCGLRGIAQLVEQLIPNQQVGSSSLSAPATHYQDTFGCLFFV